MNKIFFLPVLLAIFIFGCSSSKRAYNRENKTENENYTSIRVLLNEQESVFNWLIESPVYLKDGEKSLALINPGNSVSISNSEDEINLNVEGKKFKGNEFLLISTKPESSINFNGNYYKGSLKIVSDGTEIRVINILSLEEYLKGVIPNEMPVGKGTEYYDALKAFTICARTYTISKLKENKASFDVFSDTRDQVYGGCSLENNVINNLVEDTRGLILTYDGVPAMTLYHSTCGGYTENVKNVFPKIDAPYLKGIKDGNEPFCSISPKFTWTEEFTEQTFIQRLASSGYIDNSDYSITGININSLFKSGRINEMEINLVNDVNSLKTIKLYGNNIRYVIRTADNKSILESNNFKIKKDSDGIIQIIGKGYGHGVGLCQWGALEQSKEGKSYEEILSFYYPGTKIESYND
jgi:stage II sporulation protein D (peptidoglycan lytic transglycosylase)